MRYAQAAKVRGEWGHPSKKNESRRSSRGVYVLGAGQGSGGVRTRERR